MNRFFLLAACAALAACETPVEAPPAAPAQADVAYIYGAPSNQTISDLLDAPGSGAGSEFMRLDTDVMGAVSSATSARDAAQRAASLIATASDPRVRSVLEETAAQELLARWGSRATPAEWDVLAAATDVLVRRESPQALLVWTGLDAVGDRWDASRRREAAVRTLAALDAAGLQRCQACEDGGGLTLTSAQAEAFGPDAAAVRQEMSDLDAQMAAEAAGRNAAVRALERLAG